MMSQRLYRMSHLSARRPWAVIGTWLMLAVFVVGAASAFGHKLEDSFRVEGLDSQQANDLIAAAGTGQEGLTAQVVVTPRGDAATFFDSRRRARLSRRSRRMQPRCHACCRPAIRADLWPPGPTRHGTAGLYHRTAAWRSCASSTRRWKR